MDKEQEFLKRIEEVLQAHEDTYEPGAWEEFDANRKKDKRKWPIYGWAVAAAILIIACFGLFEIVQKDGLDKGEVVVKNRNQQRKPKVGAGADANGDLALEKTHRSVKDDLIAINRVETTIGMSRVHGNNLVVVAERNENLNVEQVDQTHQQPVNAPPIKDTSGVNLSFEKRNKNRPVLAGAYDSLMKRNQVVAISTPRKLTYSVVVSPSMSNQKVNIGAGMEFSYKLGAHLSLNSGLLYSAINAKSDGKSNASTSANAYSDSQIANLSISGIELPLGIQYQTKSGFYATAGVSALGVINDKLEYSFLQDKTVMQTQLSANGVAYEELKVVSEKKTEKSIEPLNNYMGFFNFSAGKKQAFGNIHLNIGPFVKVPFSSVSAERIKLVQGGIKVGIDF